MLEDDDFIQSFVEEAKVHVETVETELLQLDTSNVNAESINNIFRAVFPVKCHKDTEGIRKRRCVQAR